MTKFFKQDGYDKRDARVAYMYYSSLFIYAFIEILNLFSAGKSFSLLLILFDIGIVMLLSECINAIFQEYCWEEVELLGVLLVFCRVDHNSDIYFSSGILPLQGKQVCGWPHCKGALFLNLYPDK